ncbi:hypothetical protein VUR80DRAFT_4932 [Thermomyces stellatus]
MLQATLFLLMSSSTLLHAQTYQLRIYAGNDEVHGSLLRFGNTQAAFVPLASESDDYPPVVIQDDPGAPLGSFLVRDSNDTAFAPQHLALVGPSGRYRIVASEHSNGTDPGSFFMSNEWRFVESDGRAVLRHGWDRAPAGSWIVERRGQGWVLWWYEPREENMGDLEEYVLVDVEVERLDGGRVESIDRVSGEGSSVSVSLQDDVARANLSVSGSSPGFGAQEPIIGGGKDELRKLFLHAERIQRRKQKDDGRHSKETELLLVVSPCFRGPD